MQSSARSTSGAAPARRPSVATADAASMVPCYIVVGAGGVGQACNGQYLEAGTHNGKAKFVQADGPGIVYFDRWWKLSGKGNTTGWFYLVKEDGARPPVGSWTTKGYGTAAAPAPHGCFQEPDRPTASAAAPATPPALSPAAAAPTPPTAVRQATPRRRCRSKTPTRSPAPSSAPASPKSPAPMVWTPSWGRSPAGFSPAALLRGERAIALPGRRRSSVSVDPVGAKSPCQQEERPALPGPRYRRLSKGSDFDERPRLPAPPPSDAQPVSASAGPRYRRLSKTSDDRSRSRSRSPVAAPVAASEGPRYRRLSKGSDAGQRSRESSQYRSPVRPRTSSDVGAEHAAAARRALADVLQVRSAA